MRTRLPPASSVFLVLSLFGIVLGAVLRWGADEPDAANLVWGVTTAIGLVPIAWEVLSGIVHRQAGVDVIALLAMAGALALGEVLAGAVIAVMLASGRLLETYAGGRAQARAARPCWSGPRGWSIATRTAGWLAPPPLGEVPPGEALSAAGQAGRGRTRRRADKGPGSLRGPGRVGPDRRGRAGRRCATATRSAAGWSTPGPRSTCASTTTCCDQSTYAGILRLVEQAQGVQRAPFVRLADRYALAFVPLTLAVAGVAWLVRRGGRASAVRAGGGDALPADPGRPGGDRRRHACAAFRRDRDQERRSAGYVWPAGGCCCSTRPAP